MSDILALPRNYRRRWWLLALLALITLTLVSAGIAAIATWRDWNRLDALAPAGGLYFLRRVELPVPSFRQNDPRWGKDWLGATEDTLGSAGCAVSSAAMVLGYYGIDTDPQRLNWQLQTNEGYTPKGWIYWEKAAEIAPERVRHIYEDKPSYWLIDSNLLRGNPVIVRVQQPRNKHFVVIAGKDGYDYLTQDPGAGAKKGLYPLRELGSKIEALRFYEKLN